MTGVVKVFMHVVNGIGKECCVLGMKVVFEVLERKGDACREFQN